jgi:hypothetical protein
MALAARSLASGGTSRLIEQLKNAPGPVDVPNSAWRPALKTGKPIVDLFLAEKWWSLQVDDNDWATGRRRAFQRIASGEAIVGNLIIRLEAASILLRTQAWFPQQAPGDDAAGGRLQSCVRNKRLDEISLGKLRDAIRANLVSFPNPPPAAPNCAVPDLQRKIVLLYFVRGWSLVQISARYAISKQGARRIVDHWAEFAVRTGYMQKIISVGPH